MDHKDLYAESRRLVEQARAMLDEYEGKEMPAETAEQFDRLMEQSDKAKADADRRKGLLDRDAELQGLASTGSPSTGSGGGGFDKLSHSFEAYDDPLPEPLRKVAMQLGTPAATLGGVGGAENAAAVKRVADELYPAKAYGGLAYEELRWKHRTAFGKWMRWGTSGLDQMDRKLGFGGRVILTPRQIATAVHGGIGAQQLKDLVEGSDVAGGFLVPEDFRAEVVRGIPDAVVMRPRARVVQTSRDVVRAPKITGNGNSYSSAVRLTWGAETPAAGSHETEPTFGQVAIPVHTAMASTQISLDLMEDAAFPLDSLLQELYVEAFALGEDDEFLTGDGNGKPQGLTAAAALGLITAVNSGDANLLTPDGLIALQYALAPQYWPNAIFTMNATSAGKAIRQLKDGNGDYLWQRGLAAMEPDLLLGKPIAYSAFMPDVAANAYPVVFGDFRHYWIADRVGMTLQRLSEIYAEQNMVGFVARKRVGGQVVLPAAFRAQKVSA